MNKLEIKYLAMVLGLMFLCSANVFGAATGDVDGSGAVDIKDAVVALQISAGFKPTVNRDADVNGDGKIGLEEAVFAIQFTTLLVNKTYWADTSDSFLNYLELSVGETRVIRLKAEVPAEKILKAFCFELTYDNSILEVVSVKNLCPFKQSCDTNNDTVNGRIITNGYVFGGVSVSGGTSGVTISVIDVAVKGLKSGSSVFGIRADSFGTASDDQFPPTPVPLTIEVKY